MCTGVPLKPGDRTTWVVCRYANGRNNMISAAITIAKCIMAMDIALAE